jgi:hypothetical protein
MMRGKPSCHPAPWISVVMYGAIWRQLQQELEAHALGEGALVQVGVGVVLDAVVAAVGLALEVRVWWERTRVDLLSASL